MMVRVKVWERSLGEPRPVGDLIAEIEDNGRLRSAFQYDSEFLRRKEKYALDPVSLPLQGEAISAVHPGFLGVFEDSLPDDWGRNLLIRKQKIARRDQHLPGLLLALGSSGLGALSYSAEGRLPESDPEVSSLHLSELVEAAARFERGEPLDSVITLLLSAGSSPGGARPKAVVVDDETGLHYIAKFPSVKDQVDVVRIEEATLQLARQAGLLVPETRLLSCSGKMVLLVRRFDVIPEGRRHMISFQTLLKATGYYQHRYYDLLLLVRKYSRDPQVDSERLFRQMVFNALVGNTDDHLKNFMMIHDHQQGWRLSPAFDLIPDIGQRREHVLFFDLDAHYPGRRELERLGRQWGIGCAGEVVDEVVQSLREWRNGFAEVGVSEQDAQRFSEIDFRLDGVEP